MFRVKIFIALAVLCFFDGGGSVLAFDTESPVLSDQNGTQITLPLLVKEGTPGEVMTDDPVVPAQEGFTDSSSGTGSVLSSIQEQISIPVSNSGAPGALSQVRGFGSAEDLDVQVFGLSMNPPQGGGFNLAEFPQFLWDEYRFSSGPSLSGLNSSASSGTLSLVPWTVRALREEENSAEGSLLYSTSGLTQISARAAILAEGGRRPSAAVVAGLSTGGVEGPSGGVSTSWGKNQYSGRFHLLATDLDMESKGSVDYPTPGARLGVIRVVPVLQSDLVFGLVRVKNSFYYHLSELKYRSSVDSFLEEDGNSVTSTQEWGTHTALLFQSWKVGFGGCQTFYESRPWVETAVQTSGTLQVSKQFKWNSGDLERGSKGGWTFDPVLQMIWISGWDARPQGSFGFRRGWKNDTRSLFSRFSVSSRYPSLLDRYGRSGEYWGNPSLEPETDWTALMGGEMKGQNWNQSLQIHLQYRQKSRVLARNSMQNFGDAVLGSGTLRGGRDLTLWANLTHSSTFSFSRLLAPSVPFPYVPVYLGVSGLQINPRGLFRKVSLKAAMRIESGRTYDFRSLDRLSGYVLFDTSVIWNFARGFFLSGKLENLADQPIELVKGYPLRRALSIALVGSL